MNGCFRVIAAFGLAAAPQLAVAADAPTTITGVSAEKLFDLAEYARSQGDLTLAQTVYEALSRNPDIEIRSEARFRLGMMLAEQKRYTDAALRFRAILDEKPDVARVRLELARVLALMGDEAGARKQIRQARAGGLPPDVALVVDQFANALRSSKLWGGSFEIALAPDSNINRATDAKTLDTVIAPLNLSQDARAQSGLGLKPSGQLYVRAPIGDRVTLVPRLSGQALLYRAHQFEDVSASAQVGVEWRAGQDRVTPSAGYTWRWYGRRPYARTQNLGLDWLHPMGPRAQITTDVGIGRADYTRNDDQDGALYNADITYDRALTPKSGASLSFSAVRQTARDPGYSTTSAGPTLLYWRDAGKFTAFASGSLRRLEADERLTLYRDRREERYARVAAGAVLRQFQVAGFSPVVRVSYERNTSTVGLYDYRRLATEIGVSRAF